MLQLLATYFHFFTVLKQCGTSNVLLRSQLCKRMNDHFKFLSAYPTRAIALKLKVIQLTGRKEVQNWTDLIS